MARLAFAVVALAVLFAGLVPLARSTAGLVVNHADADGVPVTFFRRADAAAGPVVVLAHGFAGSQQMMQPLAVTLARDGWQAVTFDFPGHGRNAAPLEGGLADPESAERALLGAVSRAATAALALPGAEGRLALVGHSMAAEIVLAWAMAHPEAAATVAISTFSGAPDPGSPRNVLVIDGAWEMEALHEAARRTVGADGVERRTYGSFAEGTARRYALAEGAEHIGVVYARDTLAETRAFLDAAFGRPESDAPLDRRGGAIGLLYLGILLCGRAAIGFLPHVAAPPVGGAPESWRRVLPLALLPALATPLLLALLPSHVFAHGMLPLLLGDYLAAHLALYGILTLAGLGLAGRLPKLRPPGRRFVVATAALTLLAVLAVALPTDRWVVAYLPVPARLPLVAGVLAGTLPFFLADEWLTRGPGAPRLLYPATKLLFLLSLGGAVALDPQRLLFLVVIMPAMLAFFVFYGLFSRWCWRRTGHPLVAGIANAIAVAWAIGVTFPIVAP